jgi:hypothetical protein
VALTFPAGRPGVERGGPELAMFGVRRFGQGPDAARLSARILDAETTPEHTLLEANCAPNTSNNAILARGVRAERSGSGTERAAGTPSSRREKVPASGRMKGAAAESPARTYGLRTPSSVAFGDTFSLREKGGAGRPSGARRSRG